MARNNASGTKGSRSRRHCAEKNPLIRKIGLAVHQHLYQSKKPVEQLAFQSGVARSSIREIIAGRSNPRILTLHAIAKGMGYSGVIEFLRSLESESQG